FYDGLPLLLVLRRRDRIGATDGRIDRTDQRRTIQHDHLIDYLHHVFQAVLLLLRCAAQVTVRANAGARPAPAQPALVQLALYIGWVDMRGIFDGDFDAFEAPTFEFGKQLGAVVGEGGSEEESIYAESHNGNRG